MGPAPPLQIAVRAALAALCLAGTVVALQVHRSNSRIAEGFNAVLVNKVDAGTVAELEDADSPLNPDALRESTLALALVKTGRAADGERVARGNVAAEPENVNAWVVLARIQRTRGRTAAARRSYARAKSLNSQIPRLDVPPPL
jgi:predicted Zn-dependent protease